jgi:tight adherence protein C
MVAVLPRMGRPRLAERVAPYLIDVSDEARRFVERQTVHPLPMLGTLLAAPAAALRRAATALGGTEGIARRLRRSGSVLSVDAFRLQQFSWAVGGAALGALVAVTISLSHPVAPLLFAAVPALAGVAAFLARDRLLTRQATRRVRRMTEEFPTVLELVTLSLSAGEGILDALRRVARVGRGELAAELGYVVDEVALGIPLADALTRMADDLHMPALTRCVDAIGSALERGTPLAEVLRAQAADAREVGKRELLESAGKKEVAMLVPLVFLLLPITVLFAIYPGVFVLQSGF